MKIDEMLTQIDRLPPFFQWLTPEMRPDAKDLPGWQRQAEGYLSELGRWKVIKSYLEGKSTSSTN